MPTILFVRHGQASFGSADYDQLSELGERQARVAAAAIAQRGLNIQRVVSGSLKRQRDTAAPFAETLGRGVEIDERWNEFSMEAIIAAHTPDEPPPPSPGGGSQVSAADFQDLLEAGLTGWIAAGEDTTAAESWPAFSRRVHAALGELAVSLDSGVTAVVFTSGGVIAAASSGLLEAPATQLLPLNRVTVNAGITKVVAGRHRALSLISFNDHAHLEGGPDRLVTYR